MSGFRYSMIASALLFSACFLLGCTGGGSSFSDLLPGNGPKTVGTDVKMPDITEFYFTYSSSTYPPEFQRYRFLVKNGAHLFHHEKREGDHWPLTEKVAVDRKGRHCHRYKEALTGRMANVF